MKDNLIVAAAHVKWCDNGEKPISRLMQNSRRNLWVILNLLYVYTDTSLRSAVHAQVRDHRSLDTLVLCYG